jgi:hypothetical protein
MKNIENYRKIFTETLDLYLLLVLTLHQANGETTVLNVELPC